MEVASVHGIDSGAGPSVEEDHRLALRVAALLEMDGVQPRDLETTHAIRPDRRKEPLHGPILPQRGRRPSPEATFAMPGCRRPREWPVRENSVRELTDE